MRCDWKRFCRIALCVVVSFGMVQAVNADPTLTEVQSFSVSGGISQAVYSDQYNLLFLRDSGNDIRIFDTITQTQISIENRRSATSSFTDLHLSPSGRYLYAADYGGTNTGYGTPSTPSYVHRFDLLTRTWSVATAPGIAYRIEPVDDNRVLVQQIDQWVSVTLNTFSDGSMSQLSSASVGYAGDIAFDAKTSRMFHVESGISSENITAYSLTGNSIALAQTRSGFSYASYGAVLSADGTRFYTGPLELVASDISQSVTTFPETIGAACRNFAFGTKHYYDPNTNAQLGTFSFTPVAYALGDNATSVWAIEQPSSGAATLHRYAIAGVHEPATFCWQVCGGGSWTSTANWLPTGVVDGVDNTANFSQQTLTADATVTMDGTHVVGNLMFGDTAGHNWTLTPGSGGTLTLELSPNSGIPTINVSGQTTSIETVIAGAQGMRKAGAGRLVLSADNVYSGDTAIASGVLAVSCDSNLGAGNLAIGAGTFEAAGTINSARKIVLGDSASTIQVDPSCTYAATADASISGTGGLTKTGLGTLDLTAASLNYTGATTVSGGTLNIGTLSGTATFTVASGATANVAGTNLSLATVANSGNLNFTAGSGAISLTTLNGTGNASFAAGLNLTTLTAGTITVAGTASIATANGGMANLSGTAATITTLNNTAVSLGNGTVLSVVGGTQTAGGISGLGSLVKSGTNTFTLAANNTYSNGTTVSAGTLQIGNGGTAGSIIGDVINNATLTFKRSDAYVFGGNISGTGAVNQAGSGTLTLIGTNTCSQITTIKSGTLQVGDGTTAGQISGDIANSGALVFNLPATTQTYMGAVSGTGSFIKTGSGTQVLAGNSTYTGGTTILAGALQIGCGGTSGNIVGNITNTSSLVFSRSDSFSFTGNVSGGGTLTQAGPGTVVLSGAISNSVVASAGRIVTGSTCVFNGDVTTAGGGRVENTGAAIHIANLDNGGVLSGNADVSGTFLNRSTASVSIGGGQRLFLQSFASQVNEGMLSLIGTPTAPAEFESTGAFVNAPSGNSMIAARNAILRFGDGLANRGAVAISYGISDVFGKIENTTDGTIAIGGGAGVTFYDDVTQNGSLVVSALNATHSSAVFFGAFTGSGGFTGGGDVFCLGDLRPGNSPARVCYDGNMFLGHSARTVMELGGLIPGTQYDVIDVTGQMVLDGTFEIALLDGFSPSVGDKFDLFNGNMTGQFAFVSLPSLGEGKAWDISDLYTTGVVSVTVPEPSTSMLLAIAFVGGLACGWRRRKVRDGLGAAHT